MKTSDIKKVLLAIADIVDDKQKEGITGFYFDFDEYTGTVEMSSVDNDFGYLVNIENPDNVYVMKTF